MNKTIGFVVLNYNNHHETVDCVSSILCLGQNAPIVVVDNCSPNNSFEILQARFSGFSTVTVVQAPHNGGYSIGNNIGISILRQLDVNNVVIATSDTRILSTDLIERCLSARDAGIAVVGPYIISDQFCSSNPLLHRLTIQYIAAIHLGPLWTAIKYIGSSLLFFKANSQQHDSLNTSMRTSVPYDVYMVHGCFLFLSEHYLSQIPQLDEDLFMYGEEDLIAFNCICHGLRIVYDPRMHVFHGDSKSTSSTEFRLRESSRSMAILRKKLPLISLLHAYLSTL